MLLVFGKIKYLFRLCLSLSHFISGVYSMKSFHLMVVCTSTRIVFKWAAISSGYTNLFHIIPLGLLLSAWELTSGCLCFEDFFLLMKVWVILLYRTYFLYMYMIFYVQFDIKKTFYRPSYTEWLCTLLIYAFIATSLSKPSTLSIFLCVKSLQVGSSVFSFFISNDKELSWALFNKNSNPKMSNHLAI